MFIEDRLKKHLSNHKGFTGKAKDWEVIIVRLFDQKKDAKLLEHRIKKRGAHRFLQDEGLI